jgi:hypothetical protein
MPLTKARLARRVVRAGACFKPLTGTRTLQDAPYFTWHADVHGERHVAAISNLCWPLRSRALHNRACQILFLLFSQRRQCYFIFVIFGQIKSRHSLFIFMGTLRHIQRLVRWNVLLEAFTHIQTTPMDEVIP